MYRVSYTHSVFSGIHNGVTKFISPIYIQDCSVHDVQDIQVYNDTVHYYMCVCVCVFVCTCGPLVITKLVVSIVSMNAPARLTVPRHVCDISS